MNTKLVCRTGRDSRDTGAQTRVEALGRREFLRWAAGGTLLFASGCGGGGTSGGPKTDHRKYTVRHLFNVGVSSDASASRTTRAVSGEVGKWYGVLNAAGDVLALDYEEGKANFVPAFVYRDGQKVDTDLRNVASFNYFTPPPRWYDMNDSGQILVTQYVLPGPGNLHTRGVLWENGRETDLGDMGVGWVFATGLNNRGEAVAFERGGSSVSWIWRGGERTSLGEGEYEDINNAGQAVGVSRNAVVLWDAGRITELPRPAGESSRATGLRLNDSGAVIGNFESGSPRMWEGVSFRALDGMGWAYGLNNPSIIVGLRWQEVRHDHPDGSGFSIERVPSAVKWEDGTTIDLNTLIPPHSGWLLEQAVDINDSGRIIGLGQFQSQSATFLLTPETS